MSYPKKQSKFSKTQNPNACIFCRQTIDDELNLGKWYKCSESFRIHYFCLLLASGLQQRGERDEDGILGFLPEDIMAEYHRGSRLKCHYCKVKGATIGCVDRTCRTVFHLPCGIENGTFHRFLDTFPSYCPKHKPQQNVRACFKKQKDDCPICVSSIEVKETGKTLFTPCCQKWLHHLCIQNFARNAGYFFRCPLCNNKDIFIKEAKEFGVFVPEQDASWELEANAFTELLYRPSTCEALKCLCSHGRHYNQGIWKLVVCSTCGSTSCHAPCAKLAITQVDWKCQDCVVVLNKNSYSLRKGQVLKHHQVEGQISVSRSKVDQEVLLDEEHPSGDSTDQDLVDDKHAPALTGISWTFDQCPSMISYVLGSYKQDQASAEKDNDLYASSGRISNWKQEHTELDKHKILNKGVDLEGEVIIIIREDTDEIVEIFSDTADEDCQVIGANKPKEPKNAVEQNEKAVLSSLSTSCSGDEAKGCSEWDDQTAYLSMSTKPKKKRKKRKLHYTVKKKTTKGYASHKHIPVDMSRKDEDDNIHSNENDAKSPGKSDNNESSFFHKGKVKRKKKIKHKKLKKPMHAVDMTSSPSNSHLMITQTSEGGVKPKKKERKSRKEGSSLQDKKREHSCNHRRSTVLSPTREPQGPSTKTQNPNAVPGKENQKPRKCYDSTEPSRSDNVSCHKLKVKFEIPVNTYSLRMADIHSQKKASSRRDEVMSTKKHDITVSHKTQSPLPCKKFKSKPNDDSPELRQSAITEFFKTN